MKIKTNIRAGSGSVNSGGVNSGAKHTGEAQPADPVPVPAPVVVSRCTGY